MSTHEGPRVGCGAAIVREGRILLLKRLRAPEPNHWGIPGGRVERYERVEDALVREVEEELGIRLGSVQLLGVVDQIDERAEDHWVSPVYLATAFSGEPRLMEPEKHERFGWFALEGLPEPLTISTRTALSLLKLRATGAAPDLSVSPAAPRPG